MIFTSLAKFIKAHLTKAKPIEPLLFAWMRMKLIEKPAADNVARIIQAEFSLHELKRERSFLIIPNSQRAGSLLRLLREYMAVMESTRLERLEEARA